MRSLRKERVKILRTLDLLIIDEISMVRADILDAIDDILKRYRRNDRPFGGVQLLMIGGYSAASAGRTGVGEAVYGAGIFIAFLLQFQGVAAAAVRNDPAGEASTGRATGYSLTF